MALPQVHVDPFFASRTRRQYLQPGEQEILLALIASVQPRVVVEIGVNEGMTASAILKHVPGIELYYGIDVDAGYRFEIPEQAVERPCEPGVLVRDDPRFELRIHGGPMPMWADAVFIDGDHGYHRVIEDSEWAAGVVRPEGIIIWHDYGNWTVQVTEALDELHGSGRKIYNVTNTWLAFERV